MECPVFHRKLQHRSNGFGLVETLLVIGAVGALSLGIYMVLKPSSANAQAKVEQDNLRQLSSAIERSMGLLGTFEGGVCFPRGVGQAGSGANDAGRRVDDCLGKLDRRGLR